VLSVSVVTSCAATDNHSPAVPLTKLSTQDLDPLYLTLKPAKKRDAPPVLPGARLKVSLLLSDYHFLDEDLPIDLEPIEIDP
jgi:hypothetical protein